MNIEPRPDGRFIQGIVSTARGLALHFPIPGSNENMTFTYPKMGKPDDIEVIQALDEEFPNHHFEIEADSLLCRIKVVAKHRPS